MRSVSMSLPPTIIVRNPAIAITFDDGNVTEYTEGFAYMNARNIKGTLYAITDLVDTPNFVTTNQLSEMYAAGWDIGNHTKDHADLATLSLAEVQANLSTARDWLDTHGFTRSSRYVCYPFGSYNSTVLAAMDSLNMLTGRTILEQYDSISLDMPYEIKGIQLNAAKTLATLKSYVDTALSQNRLLVAYIHAINSSPVSYDISIANFQAFIDYVVSTGIQTLTIDQIYRSKFVLP